MLSKEGFCKALRMVKDQESIDEQFSKALNLVGDGHFVFGAENKYLLALRDVLKEAVNDQYDYIDWWLYEATDDYTVWEADCTMKYCLKEPEALYTHPKPLRNQGFRRFYPLFFQSVFYRYTRAFKSVRKDLNSILG